MSQLRSHINVHAHAHSDGNIRYFEYENGKFEYLSEYKSADPQRGLAFLPKRGINLHENEVMRAFKTVNDAYIEPISFIVPRRSEVFQGDIYPPVVGSKAAFSAAEWLDGKTGLPPKISLESIYEGGEATEVPSDYKPTVTAAPQVLSPVKKQAEVPKETAAQPTPTARAPPPSMTEQTSSIKDLASKFVDKDAAEEDEDEDTSSFEEIPKPVDRSDKQVPTAARQPEKVTETAPGPAAIEQAPQPGMTRSTSQLWQVSRSLSI